MHMIVKMNDEVEGPSTIKDSTNKGRNENNDNVFGFAYAWKH